MSSKKKLKNKIRKLEDRLYELEVNETRHHTQERSDHSHTQVQLRAMAREIAELRALVKGIGPTDGPFAQPKGPWDPSTPTKPWNEPNKITFDASSALDAVDKAFDMFQKFTKPQQGDDKK